MRAEDLDADSSLGSFSTINGCGRGDRSPATHKKKHPKIKTGKACINFREADSLPLSDIAAVLTAAFAPAN